MDELRRDNIVEGKRDLPIDTVRDDLFTSTLSIQRPVDTVIDHYA